MLNPAVVCFAQLSDCHLYHDKSRCHELANPYDNLARALADVAQKQSELDFVLLTGDLAQTEDAATYQLLADLVRSFHWQLPIYWLPGNHDDKKLAADYLCDEPFVNFNSPHGQLLTYANWQILLLDSTKQGCTEGLLSAEYLASLPDITQPHVLLALHHHVKPFNSFIDKYITEYDEAFNQWVTKPQVKGLIHGHVHSAVGYLFLGKPVYACPATSVEFIHQVSEFATGNTTGGYNIIRLQDNGDIQRETIWL
ncbi:hypothetical protein C2869_17935 [Saccharobesus litoralis]|uniref:Calcineurin-like phosphoesterase domain-containing protein n=1 Tax=Saccharobesus litoralis TaxID=2172099 RepID=A0A2S0VVD9_9ALTE|nr:metallophosphoesterase [Saccharobesus litoralis]AWB68179.1 hypothetical protein C2869_17935 [Saccharobesus litoralis]